MDLGGLRHVVLFKVKEGAPLDDLIKCAKNLEGIPGVIFADFGENTLDFFEGYPNRSHGFTHTLIVHLRGVDDLIAYTPHPIHQEFVKLMADWKTDILAMDFKSKM